MGKALGIPPAELMPLSHSVDAHSATAAAARLVKQLPPAAPHHLTAVVRIAASARWDIRHLGIHNGGMLIATAAGRAGTAGTGHHARPRGGAVGQERRGGLRPDQAGRAGAARSRDVTDALAEIERSGAKRPMAQLDLADAEIYAMLAGGDTIGPARWRAEAQMNWPALAAHPIKRADDAGRHCRPAYSGRQRQPAAAAAGGAEAGQLCPRLPGAVLRDTYGVLLYQEQAIQMPMAAAGLRRAKRTCYDGHWREDEGDILGRCGSVLSGAARQGIDAAEAQTVLSAVGGLCRLRLLQVTRCRSLALVAMRICGSSAIIRPFLCRHLEQPAHGLLQPEGAHQRRQAPRRGHPARRLTP
ncbi:MAG: hypothetical protein R2911_39225 [Caldilineaceae bacterium]